MIPTERSSTPSISAEEYGESGLKQRSVGFLGSRRRRRETLLLRDGALRPFTQATQSYALRLHREHGSPRPTRPALVGTVDVRERMRSDGQLRASLGKLRGATFDRLDREALEVRGDEWKVSPSGARQGLWTLCFDLFERESARTFFARLFEPVFHARLR